MDISVLDERNGGEKQWSNMVIMEERIWWSVMMVRSAGCITQVNSEIL